MVEQQLIHRHAPPGLEDREFPRMIGFWRTLAAIVDKRVFDMMKDGARCHRRVSTIQTISYACPKTKTVSYYDNDHFESSCIGKRRTSSQKLGTIISICT
ncbi:hypothetical protein Aduo_007289 [Ancylostoma duodenale]